MNLLWITCDNKVVLITEHHHPTHINGVSGRKFWKMGFAVVLSNNCGPSIWMSFTTYYFIGGNHNIIYLIILILEGNEVSKYVVYFFLESLVLIFLWTWWRVSNDFLLTWQRCVYGTVHNMMETFLNMIYTGAFFRTWYVHTCVQHRALLINFFL